MNKKAKKFADGGAVPEHDFVAERLEYRKKPDYFGYEDYTPSGRVAIRKYVKEAENAKDFVKRKDSNPYSPSAAKKAQAAQREYEAELKRVSRGTAQEGTYKKGGKVGSASKRADGIAKKGKTKGRFV